MNVWWFLLANRAAWEQLHERLYPPTVSWRSWLGLVVLTLIIGGLVGLSKWLTSRDKMLGDGNTDSVFRELAAAHALSWRDRWLLRRTAIAARLDHPAHVFIDPSVYENKEVAERLVHVWPRILEIRDRLFADIPETKSPADTDGADAEGADADAADADGAASAQQESSESEPPEQKWSEQESSGFQ